MDLDPRLKIKVVWPVTDRTRRLNYLLTRTGGLDFGGWHYDYDGIGTVLDGKIQRNGVGYAMLSAIYAKGRSQKLQNLTHIFIVMPLLLKIFLTNLPKKVT